jgi:hypothetical protein
MTQKKSRKNLYLYALVFAVSAAVGLFLAKTSYAGELADGKTASVVSNWKEGDNKGLTVKIGKQKEANGRLTNEDITYDVDIKVIGENEDGYTIEWIYNNITYSGSNPFVKKLYKTSEGLKIVYTTGKDGMFRELVNWKEVQEHLYGALDLLENEFPDNQAIKGLISQFKALYSSRDSIESTLRDIQIYHSPYGGEYTLGEWTSTETTLPNHLGGYPFPAVIKTGMTELDLVKNRCKIVASQKIDEEKAASAVKEFLRTTAEKSAGPRHFKESEQSGISINDVFEYDVELNGGWVNKAYFKRETRTGPAKGVNTYEITLR